MKVAEWYTEFLKYSEPKTNLILLTNSKKPYQEAQKRKILSMLVCDFVNLKCKKYPDLVDFLGATDVDEK